MGMSVLISATSTLLVVLSMPQTGAGAIEAVVPIKSVTSEQQGAVPPLPRPLLFPPHDPIPHHEEVLVIARDRGYAPDPIRALNAESFKITEAVDKAFVGPAAMAYQKVVPSPLRSGVHNFLYNLREPVVFVNFVLQHNIGKATETVGRFAINSVAGVAGIFDIAKRRPFKLPRRGNGFADTLGFYGIHPGPFLFLPLVGPTTVRDLIGGAVDRLVLPLALGHRVRSPAFVVPSAVLGALDHRSDFDETLHALHDGAVDPYANSRDFYLQRRQAEIDHLRGRPGTGNTSPMSERPKGPILLRGQVLAPTDGEAPRSDLK